MLINISIPVPSLAQLAPQLPLLSSFPSVFICLASILYVLAGLSQCFRGDYKFCRSLRLDYYFNTID